MKDEMIFTYQTRVALTEKEEAVMQKYALLLSSVERSLYAQTTKGSTTASCKNHFLKRFGITARQFNACRVSLEGKIAACRSAQERALKEQGKRLQSLEKEITRLENKPSKRFALHQKKRRKATLSHRLSTLQQAYKSKRVSLCFGGAKLFKAQFHLEKNSFSSHEEWKKKWLAKRNSEFFVLGSKDETSGNQTCSARLEESGTFCLRLRLPKAFEQQDGKYLELKNIFFAYGQEAVLASLNDPEGQALSYRFKKDDKGWRVFVSTALKKALPLSKEGIGVIGIDLNVDHIACVETDRFGNPIWKKTFPWISYGKSKEQQKAITGEICKKIVDLAKEKKKPLVVEKLDFQKKKQTLKEGKNSKHSRLLSSFAYGLFFNFLSSRAYKQGIVLHQVNPAFTSIIGHVNYAKRYGLSTHLAAALCIARRYQNFSEKPCFPTGTISDGKGDHLAFVLPVRNRTKHVWSFWGQVKKKLKAVLAAHFRAKKLRSLNPINSIQEIDPLDCCRRNSGRRIVCNTA